jgi:aspartate carbamoyltransferase catalytic subunit
VLSIVSTDLADLIARATAYVDNSAERDGRRLETLVRQKVAAVILDEPSTRTRFSTESAAIRLGLGLVVCDNLSNTSLAKLESVVDTAQILSVYFDLVAIRSRHEGLPRLLSYFSNIPTVNLGDGTNEHPTQALATFVTLRRHHKSLHGLHIAIWGDLELSRVAHSVFLGAVQLGLNVTLLPVLGYQMPDTYRRLGRSLSPNSDVKQVDNPDDVPDAFDVLYVTREQWERRPEKRRSERYIIPDWLLQRAPLILHPLPRGPEMTPGQWSRHRKQIFDHVNVTFLVRQWAIWAALNRTFSLPERFTVPVIITGKCTSARCAGQLLSEDDSPPLGIIVDDTIACFWCLQAVNGTAVANYRSRT